ncbi:MAG: ABC transporter ATP-binding protein [Oscillochloris sp.]|nr:ABC transporter ATP-binding protein [Oscillochloris sp.]
MSVIHEDVEQLEEGLAHMIPDLIGGLTVPLITVGVLFAVDWRMALATIALLPFAVAMYGWVSARSNVAEYNAINGRINSVVIQYINGMKVLKTFLRADDSFTRLRKASEEMRAYYATMVGEGGATLSGGEKQRVSIARALLKDAPIVMLDEATASIDPENEWLIQQAFDALAAEKTVIVIAHRLATLQRADQILVLEHGQLVQRGTHAE